MNENKITGRSLEEGSFKDALHHEMYRADLSPEGRERVADAMKAAVEHVAHKEGLQYGVGGKHVDPALHFLDTHYEGRHELKPKERELIESSLRSHFGLNEEKEAA